MKNGTYTCSYHSPIGALILASDGVALTGLWFQGQKYESATLQDTATPRELPVFAQAKQWLDRYFSGQAPQLDVPLAPAGSEFRQAVWKILCDIPYGQLTTYGQIAQTLRGTWSKPVSAQAVGGAVGHNPISILIPCHRVVGSNGSLTGYAAGIQKKVWLLEREGAPMDGLFVPQNGTAL